MRVEITDTLTDYFERIEQFNGEGIGESVKFRFIDFVNHFGEVPVESGSLITSPYRHSTVTDTGSSVDINVTYSGDAPYSYRITREWTDFLPDEDYAYFQHEEVHQNYGYVIKPFMKFDFKDEIGTYYMKFLKDSAE